jgi:hypothetical protein
LAFFSKKLSATEMRYSTFDRELLAAFSAVKHFRFFLEGRPFTLFTDHKPLVSAISKAKTPFSSRQQRQLSFLLEFTTTFVHLPGHQNVVADTLSRPSPPPTADTLTAAAVAPAIPAQLFPLPLSYTDIAKAQQTCPSISALQSLPSLHITAVQLSPQLSLLGDVSTKTFRPLIPTQFQKQIFHHIHSIGHPGINATRRLISARFVWAHMATDIREWTRQCIDCQKAKIHTHVSLPPSVIPIPERRFSHIHVDLVGPLPPSQGCTHIFTMVDRTTRWMEAVPLSTTTAAACAEALCSAWISRFGIPHTITSDRGTQFTSSIWSQLSSFLHISHITTTAFHPQSNGMVERFHRRLKDTLRARCSSPDWVAHLPWCLLAFRSSPHELSNSSPAEAVFGTPLVLPGEFPASPEDDSSHFLTSLSKTLSGSQTSPAPPESAQDIPLSLMTAQFVFILAPPSHPPLSPSYAGPYKVLRRFPRCFLLQLGDRQETVSVSRLKPAHLPPNTLPAQPPTRGRPPLSRPLPSILKKPSTLSSKPSRKVTFQCPLPSSRSSRPRKLPARFSDFILE